MTTRLRNSETPAAAVVLCGGKSSRMGSGKLDLPFGEQRMLNRILQLLSVSVRSIVVVGSHEMSLAGLAMRVEPPPSTRVLFARDRAADRGPMEGLAQGLRGVLGMDEPADVVYLTSCDAPLLQQGWIEQLVASLQSHQAAVPVDESGRLHPLAAVYQVNILDQVDRLIESGQLKLQRMLSDLDTNQVAVDRLRAVDPQLLSLINVNRPEDYRQALQAYFRLSPS